MTEKVIEIDLSHTLQYNTHDIYYFILLESQGIQNDWQEIFFSFIRRKSLRMRNECFSPHSSSLATQKYPWKPLPVEILICIHKVIFFYILLQQKCE